MPTLEEAMQYLGIEIEYADAAIYNNVTTALAAARQTLHGAVGDDVEELLPDDPRAKSLVLLYLDDLYSERGLSGLKASYATRRLVATMELQLRLELIRKREEASA